MPIISSIALALLITIGLSWLIEPPPWWGENDG